MRENYDYWRFPEKPYPYKIWWKQIAGPGRLSVLQEYDLIFDKRDLVIRKLL